VKLVITGGHHTGALPVIKKLRESCPDAQIYWFGHRFSAQGDKNPTLEFHEITALNIPFYSIHAGKFYKTKNLKRLAKIPFGFFQCLFLLIKLKPNAILSFGGYIAVPTVLAGWVLGIPSVTHEQTVVAGWANRLISRVVKKVLISWKESAKYFPKGKTILVGLPLREEINQVKSNSFEVNKDLPTIYVTAGKTGSHVLNEVVGKCLTNLLDHCNVIHQCGDNSVFCDFAKLSEIKAALGKTNGRYFLQKFIFNNEIGEVYSKCDLVVSRSGANTTAELLTLKKKCVLIPIPWVSHNEQHENAKILVDAGLGIVLPEKNLSPDTLTAEIDKALRSGKTGTRAPRGLGDVANVVNPTDLIIQNLISVVRK